MSRASTAVEKSTDEAEPLELGVLADFLGPRVRILWNTISARMETALAPFGLRTGGFTALALISANPGCSQNQLAQGLGMDKSAVVAIVDELETKGFVTRVRQTADRRRYALKLTPSGRAQLQKMLVPARYGSQPVREALSRREYEQLLALLDLACSALAQIEQNQDS